MNIELAPGDLFIWMRAGIGTVRSSRIRDLAEITPEWNFMHLKILVHHRHYADREITSNTTTDLEETDSLTCAVLAIILCKPHHVFDTAFHCAGLDLTLIHIRSKDVTHG